MHSSVVWAVTAFAAVQVALAAPSPQGVSKTSRCGPSFGLKCNDSTFGDCCSQNNYCGSTDDYCSAKKGCQAGWGKCDTVSSTPSAAPKISKDGKCGDDNGATTCKGSKYGNCCSQYGWCGTTSGHCGARCNPLFGTCSVSQSSSRLSSSMTIQLSLATPSSATRSSPSSSPTSKIIKSTNARCGNAQGASPKGMSCHASQWGNCCSKNGYCGSTTDYCGLGCQPGFGDCQAIPSSKASSLTSISSSSQASPSSVSVAASSTALSISSAFSSISVISSTTIASSTPFPTPSAPVANCGVTGSPGSYRNYYESFDGSNLARCQASCVAESCSYFSLEETEIGLTCWLSTRPLAGDVPFDRTQNWVTYERSCVLPASSSSSIVSSSTVAVSSSSIAATLSSSPAAACSTPVSFTPSGQCDLVGYPATTPVILDYSILENVDLCGARCRSFPECGYIIFAKSVTACYLYGRPLAVDLPIGISGGNPQNYITSEGSCFAPVCPVLPSHLMPSVSSAASSMSSATSSSTPFVSSASVSLPSSTPLVVSSVGGSVSPSSSSATPSPTPISPPTSCRMPGYPSVGTTYDSTRQSDNDACEQRCLNDSRCQFVIYAPARPNNNCYLYDRSFGPVVPDDENITSFRSCLESLASPSLVASSTPAAASSSPAPTV